MTPIRTVAELRAVCASLPGSQETFPFDSTTLVFKVAGKMYALTDISRDTFSISVKVRPEDGERLRAEYPEQITPGYHLNKRHWISVVLDDGGATPTLPENLPAQLVRESYALVVAGLTRAQRAELAEE